MKIALPLDRSRSIYHPNPCTAPQFAIYMIEGSKQNLHYRLYAIVENPWAGEDNGMVHDEQMQACNCSSQRREDLNHISEHYLLLEVLNGCSYLLADRYCDNTQRALENAGITLFKVPSFIKEPDKAIKNFIVGVKLADTVQHIHHAS
jgi:predicted Fe-Mo cluster-binding NifX family protein